MSRIKIFIVCHKASEVPSNDIYTPIQVGRAISDIKLDMIGDDTGDNISEKNKSYCELTAMYWMWKNVKDTDYIGLCHYRRFFNYNFAEDNCDNLFADGTAAIMVAPIYRLLGVQHKAMIFVCAEDLAIMASTIRRLYPDYIDTMEKVVLGNVDYCFNMLVCRKELYDSYCEWLFNILFECEKKIKPSPYSRAQRVFGYLAEILMQIYFQKNKHKIKDIDYILKTQNGDVLKHTSMKKRVICQILNTITPLFIRKPSFYEESVLTGLKADGIDI